MPGGSSDWSSPVRHRSEASIDCLRVPGVQRSSQVTRSTEHFYGTFPRSFLPHGSRSSRTVRQPEEGEIHIPGCRDPLPCRLNHLASSLVSTSLSQPAPNPMSFVILEHYLRPCIMTVWTSLASHDISSSILNHTAAKSRAL
jgi:hypothetical protein